MLQPFKNLCHWLEVEGSTELFTLSELHKKMKELPSGSEVYTITKLKQKLLVHYKDVIFLLKLKDVTMLFVLETWLSILSMKSGTLEK